MEVNRGSSLQVASPPIDPRSRSPSPISRRTSTEVRTAASAAGASTRTSLAWQPDWLSRHCIRQQGNPEQMRINVFVVKLSLTISMLAFILLVVNNTVLAPTARTPTAMVGDLSSLYAFVLFFYIMVHTCVWGATPLLKVIFLAGFFVGLTVIALTQNPHEPWYLCYILVLDFALVVQSEDDTVLMDRMSQLMRLLAVAYVVVHVLEVGEWGPTVHVLDVKYKPINALICTLSVLLLNFSLVRSYAKGAREEAKHTNKSVEVATRVAKALVNFDLDAADVMMNQGIDYESPIHEPLSQLINNLRSYKAFLPDYLFSQAEKDVRAPADPPNEAIAEAMNGKSASWQHVSSAVSRLRELTYSLKDFHVDMQAAFPELELYRFGVSGSSDSICTSGRTGSEEYQRTLGALYAVYCIARLDIDGKEIFSFGVDSNWHPIANPSGDTAEKRRMFYQCMEWDRMLELFLRADLLRTDQRVDLRSMAISRDVNRRVSGESVPPTPTTRIGSRGQDSVPIRHVLSLHSMSSQCSVPTVQQLSSSPSDMKRSRTPSQGAASEGNRSFSLSQGHLRANSERPDSLQVNTDNGIYVNSDRMTAFLVLTAIHDVMKNPLLLPTVQKKLAPYKGVAEGSKIIDHDVSLAYIMEAFPSLLPSFNGLEPGQRAPVIFSQGKMGFNNGWLVQGEAPPGALFSTFKEVVMQGRASESDISFYFAHWLTDLAGAEPHGSQPWPGSEKFAVKFPYKVLNAFLGSFAFVDRLADASEVEVMESYLQSRWSALGLQTQPVVEGCTLAAMRVALMAQGFEAQAVTALQALPSSERDLIAMELARTGLRSQFRGAPSGIRSRPAGPALLVYYAPALIQKAGAEQVTEALIVLAAVYRAARHLFPLKSTAHARESYATIRIDALKVSTPADIHAAGSWHLRRTSETDAEAVRGGSDTVDAGVEFALIDLTTSEHAKEIRGTHGAARSA